LFDSIDNFDRRNNKTSAGKFAVILSQYNGKDLTIFLIGIHWHL